MKQANAKTVDRQILRDAAEMQGFVCDKGVFTDPKAVKPVDTDDADGQRTRSRRTDNATYPTIGLGS